MARRSRRKGLCQTCRMPCLGWHCPVCRATRQWIAEAHDQTGTCTVPVAGQEERVQAYRAIVAAGGRLFPEEDA